MDDARKPTMFRTRLKEWDPDVVLTSAKQVRDLMAQPGWLRLQELLGQVEEKHLDQLLLGKTMEQADYARLVGVVGGLRALKGAAGAVFEVAREIEVKRESQADGRAERTG